MPSNSTLRQKNEKLVAENANLSQKLANANTRIVELEEKNKTDTANFVAEIVQLRQALEENETRFVKLEQEMDALKKQNLAVTIPLPDPEISSPAYSDIVTNLQDISSVGDTTAIILAKTTSSDEKEFSSEIALANDTTKQHCGKSLEEREVDAFMESREKVRISDEMRRRNRDKISPSHKNKEAKEIVHDIFDFTPPSVSENIDEKNHVTEISVTGVTKNNDEKNSITILSVSRSKTLLNLATLYRKACDAEKQAIKANQDEILCWYHYVIEFDNQARYIMENERIGEKKAKGLVYDFIVAQLNCKRNTLRKQTQRARKIYGFFEKIGMDKIKYIKTYSANSISELSDSQIQTIIDYFSENPNTELTDEADSHIEEHRAISPDTQVSKSPREPYVNSALEKYPYLSLEHSNKYSDWYQFNRSGTCPGCEKEHSEGSVIGRHKNNSYYLKCRSSNNEKEIQLAVESHSEEEEEEEEEEYEDASTDLSETEVSLPSTPPSSPAPISNSSRCSSASLEPSDDKANDREVVRSDAYIADIDFTCSDDDDDAGYYYDMSSGKVTRKNSMPVFLGLSEI